MDKRKAIALAGAIFLVGIALTAFFLVAPPPGESGRSAPLPTEDQGAPENSARTAKGISPLLLILIFLVVLAVTTKIGRIMAKGQHKLSADEGSGSSLSVPSGTRGEKK